MPFVQDNHMVQTLPAYRADEAFAVRILPRRARCGRDSFDAHAFDTLGEVVAVDAVSITEQKSRRFLVREGVDNLLTGPFGMRIRSDVEVDMRKSFVTQ